MWIGASHLEIAELIEINGKMATYGPIPNQNLVWRNLNELSDVTSKGTRERSVCQTERKTILL